MTDLERLVREVSVFKKTRGGEARLLDDRGDLIVAWLKGSPDAPTTRDDAIEKALAFMRANGFNV